ncbi:RloB family protein [Anaerosporobacter sp.]|uniref:RloB family protein n=1 Tax=Anaerosporobacter sp. TaxID=1872529 RepID=UPI00286F502A|nr:RloB family protein [Anaerosporobacter sp.]
MPKKSKGGASSNKSDWKKKRRQDYLEKKEFQYYIFCEGEQTEPKYFEGFKRLIEDNPIYKDMVLIEIEPCAVETKRVIGKAEEYVRKNNLERGQIWCVYDKDSFPKSDFNGVIEIANSLNKQNKDIQYHAAWSNECIEIWFILHFVNYVSNNHRTEYIKFLNEKFKEIGVGKYQKNLPDIFNILLEYGRAKLAIRYAKRIIKENENKSSAMIAPGTKVFELVEELAKYLPEEVKKEFL